MFIIASLIFLGVLFTTLWQLGLMNPSYIIISLLIIAFYMAIYLIDRKRENDKLTKLVSRLKEFNEGVLGQVFDDIKGGIVGNLSQEIANVTQNTRHLVGELSIASEQLKELCQKFYSETDASAKSSQEIAETISHIAERTEDQVSACSDAVTEIVKLSDLSNLIASETAKVVSGNIEVQKSLQESSQLIEKLVNSIELTSQQNSVTAVEVDALVKEAEKVSGIISSVETIAQQTNLLSLNAAIEAARAGDMGRQFAVVADEIRKLSMNAQIAASEIKDTVQNISDRIVKLSEEIVDGFIKVQVEAQHAKIAKQSLETTSQVIEDTLESMDHINNLTNDEAVAANNIKKTIEDFSSLTQDISAAFQETAAVSEEQAAVMHNINATTASLMKVADEIYSYVEKVLKDSQYDVSSEIKTKVLNLLKHWVKSKEILSMDKEQHHKVFDKMKKEFPNFTGIITVDHTGRSIANSNPSNVTDFSFRDWFKATKSGQDYTSKMHISALTGLPTITVATPIFKDNEFIGAMSAGIRLR